MSGMVRGDVRKARDGAAPVKLTRGEIDALETAAWNGGRGGWVSVTEVAVIESIIAARIAAVTA